MKGIQITESANKELINSIWILDEDNSARCVVSVKEYKADQVIKSEELGEFKYRELAIETAPKIEGGQHLCQCS